MPWAALYRALTAAATPLVRYSLDRRCRRGKEDAAHLEERLGVASVARPAAPLVWVHAASVGEASSVLALIERILAERPPVAVLITTGTVAAARLLEGRLPARAHHQYVPVDLPRAVARFLDHWRPDLAIWVESELWPNLVLATQAARHPDAAGQRPPFGPLGGALAAPARFGAARCCRPSPFAWRRTRRRPSGSANWAPPRWRASAI